MAGEIITSAPASRQPAESRSWAELPAHVIASLRAEQICCLRQWAQLSRHRKRRIFGITPSRVALLDALAKAMRP